MALLSMKTSTVTCNPRTRPPTMTGDRASGLSQGFRVRRALLEFPSMQICYFRRRRLALPEMVSAHLGSRARTV
jgi:hypothetical protein